MKITYDHQLKIAGISIVPWNRLGPEQWLPNYAIASYYDWDIESIVPRLHALSDNVDPLPRLRRLNTTSLLEEKSFQKLLEENLPGYDLLPYKPVKIPDTLKDRKMLMTEDKVVKEYENKADLRLQFHNQLPFPGFQIIKKQDLTPTHECYQEVTRRKTKVLQDEYLKGGKGTFVVKNYEDFCKALMGLKELSRHPRVVVSDFISVARERTIQGCVTAKGIFTGPLQRQIVAHPELVNPDIIRGDKFCGAQILASDQNTPVHRELISLAKSVGKELGSHGFRGIFGIDCLQDAEGRIYFLEVNPRITGVTPLLAALYKGKNSAPFYLLHLLELGGYEYKIEDESSEFKETGALLLLHSFESQPTKIITTPKSGTYKLKNGVLQRISGNIDLTEAKPDEFVVQAYMKPGSRVLPSGRLVSLEFKRQILDENTDELYNSTVEIISSMNKHILLEKIVQEGPNIS